MKACAVNDFAATDGSKIATAICRDQIQICATSCDITSAAWFASPLVELSWLCVNVTSRHLFVQSMAANPPKQLCA